MRRTSKSNASKYTLYRKLAKMYLETHPVCERCGIVSELELDHKAGRGKYLYDLRYFQALCPRCHRWKHQYPKLAMEQGYTLNKFILDRNE